MPSTSPADLSRRRFLTVCSGVVGLSLVAGCAVPAGEDTPDPVLELIGAAERDAREFAAADASHGGYVEALHRVAEVRRIHAERLRELLTDPEVLTTPSATDAPTGAPTTDTAVTCPPVDEVRARLRSDAASAGELSVGSEGIRAELTGAVSAACTAAVEVLLS